MLSDRRATMAEAICKVLRKVSRPESSRLTLCSLYSLLRSQLEPNVKVQGQSNGDDPSQHLKGLSETRWNCRASSLRHLATERVFHAVIVTIELVSATMTDGSLRGNAAA